ncbi:hypothetical protein M0812_12970 [Anaeramoeba flamelloides]|uniref:Uncharacterized protein n=1 Tax=Anaeramoeba flamelloides TaxID=1746091 RepID=A0AAV7ZGC0_9EUKA|nr:hypothetical protein M0812_12970 [Anaeramoeba flamelloides]
MIYFNSNGSDKIIGNNPPVKNFDIGDLKITILPPLRKVVTYQKYVNSYKKIKKNMQRLMILSEEQTKIRKQNRKKGFFSDFSAEILHKNNKNKKSIVEFASSSDSHKKDSE